MSTLYSMIDGNDATFAISTSDGVKLSQVTFTKGGIALPNPQIYRQLHGCQHDLLVGTRSCEEVRPLVAIHKTQIMCHVIYPISSNRLCGQQTLSIIILGGSLQLIHRHDNTRDAIAGQKESLWHDSHHPTTSCRAARRQVGRSAC